MLLCYATLIYAHVCSLIWVCLIGCTIKVSGNPALSWRNQNCPDNVAIVLVGCRRLSLHRGKQWGNRRTAVLSEGSAGYQNVWGPDLKIGTVWVFI